MEIVARRLGLILATLLIVMLVRALTRNELIVLASIPIVYFGLVIALGRWQRRDKRSGG
jgi:hypothetical protein